ncbi:MAG TPA: hypothetical protein VME45_00695 [Stellaceae bacterium]|nr:hypothetical protein [Stellaceae bacterium]
MRRRSRRPRSVVHGDRRLGRSRPDRGGDPLFSGYPAGPPAREQAARRAGRRQDHQHGSLVRRRRGVARRSDFSNIRRAGRDGARSADADAAGVRQVNEGRHEVENQYVRAVERHGNPIAKAAVAEIFELRQSFEWGRTRNRA